jgi:type I restriction enzyme S subunit
MSHYKPYTDYRDSGVEWLGKVPEHWGVMRLKWELIFLTSGSRGWADHYADDGAFFIRIGNLTRDTTRLDLSDIQRVEVPQGTEGERTKVFPGDLLFSITAFLGSVAVAPPHMETAYVSQHVALARLSGHVLNPEWAGYVALSWVGKTYLESQGYGGTKVQLSLDDVANLIMIAPPLDEQLCIVDVLNRETSRIDGLVRRKTRFIELLREKRQALIAHAVTKGLDPSVPMKDSGVEWLGRVPAHWAACKLNFRYSVELGKMLDEKRITGVSLLPYLRNQDVQWGSINTHFLPEMDIYDDEIDRYTVKNGDLLVCEGGDVGRAAIWQGGDQEIGFQKALHRLRARCSNDDIAEFFYFSLLAAKSHGIFEQADASATIAHLPAEKFRQYRFAFPPVREQSEIVFHLKSKIGRIDTLISATERSMALLKERRSALITAAVTGQIDLREAA